MLYMKFLVISVGDTVFQQYYSGHCDLESGPRSNDLCFQLWGLLVYDKCNRKEKLCRVWLEIKPRTSHTLGKWSTKWVTQTTTFPPLFLSFHWSYEKFYPKFLCMDFIWPTITSPPHWPPNCNRRKNAWSIWGLNPQPPALRHMVNTETTDYNTSDIGQPSDTITFECVKINETDNFKIWSRTLPMLEW